MQTDPKKPEGDCRNCGGNDWWLRKVGGIGAGREWLCGRCHPRLGQKGVRVVYYNEKERCAATRRA